MGVTFTWLFALGVILVTRYTAQVDLDVDCVLYGDILYAPFDVFSINGVALGPRSAWLLGAVTLANAAFIVLGFKQLKVCTFDPALAASLGMKLREMSETQLFPVVVRTEIDYRRPAKLGDEIVIHGRLESVERARFWCAFEVRRPADDTLLITCRQSLALVQMPQGRPVRLPDDWSEKYAHLMKKAA